MKSYSPHFRAAEIRISSPRSRMAWRWPLYAVVLLVGLSAWCVGWLLADGAMLSHVSGAWLALADDATRGQFYRPLIDHAGYGGTRFAPLHVLLNAALTFTGLGVLAAGHMLSVASLLGALAGVAFWVRRAGGTWPITLLAAALPLASGSVRMLVADIRGDLLAVALGLWALAIWDDPQQRPGRRLPVTAALLAFAWFAKLTTCYGLIAIVLLSLARRQYRDACLLAAATLLLVVVLYGGIHVLSGGRMATVFAACADGGLRGGDFEQAPARLLVALGTYDPFTIGLLLMAVPLAFLTRGRMSALPVLALGAAGGMTVLIFASPGTSWNHTVDLTFLAAAVIGIATAAWGRSMAQVAITLLAIYGIAILSAATIEPAPDRRGDFHATTAFLAATAERGPILAENPIVPLAMHRPVVMLDSFMFRVIARRQADLVLRLGGEMARRHYAAVVLMHDPRTPDGVYWVERTHFYDGFCADLLRAYEVRFVAGQNIVLLPRRTAGE